MSTEAVSNSANNSNGSLFGKTNRISKLTAIISGLIVLVLLFLVGYTVTKAGHGPVAGVKGDHKVCTVNNIHLTLNENKNNGDLDDNNINQVRFSTKECGNLIMDSDHLSNIDGLLYIYQHVNINKSYGFRIVDGNYVNHVNIAM